MPISVGVSFGIKIGNVIQNPEIVNIEGKVYIF